MQRAPALLQRGIIPIRMGSTTSSTTCSTSRGDHPHTHGEHYQTLRTHTRKGGSSPYAWGARPPESLSAPAAGIIPIRMGSTLRRNRQRPESRDHPHTHGEHLDLVRSNPTSAGSSPYAWGAPLVAWMTEKVGGIIPIRMGSTQCGAEVLDSVGDHPHTHGEHRASRPRRTRRRGSSPYAWGAQVSVAWADENVRIIPIRMGSTALTIQVKLGFEDHPHTHGEHAPGMASVSWFQGSSPYAWGAPNLYILQGAGSRIIPIRMGSTKPSPPLSATSVDHPHTHGEHRSSPAI